MKLNSKLHQVQRGTFGKLITTTIAFLILSQMPGPMQAYAASSQSAATHLPQPQSNVISSSKTYRNDGHEGELSNSDHGKWLPVLGRDNKEKSLEASAMHGLLKRMDLTACLGQFDVHPNTIIRTGESQAIGGRYLQGIELNTVAECQRLCCDTDLCDVYIFESKNSGYCYLFQCGTPDNFHCKFTRHANYTSAVLTPIPKVTTTMAVNTVTPMPVVHISQQEWELSNLKLPSNGQGAQTNDNTMKNSKTQVETLSRSEVIAANEIHNKTKVLNPNVKCGRFQFACHSGECIAVYNACDGIPQCEDGSDEGPECSDANGNGLDSPNPAPSVPKQVNTAPVYHQQLQDIKQQQLPAAVIHSALSNREDANTWQNRQLFIKSHQQFADNQGGSDLHLANDHSPAIEMRNDESFTAFVQNQRSPNGIYEKTASRNEGVDGAYAKPALENEDRQPQTSLPPLPPPPPPPLPANWQGEQAEHQTHSHTLPQVVTYDSSPQRKLYLQQSQTASNMTKESTKEKLDNVQGTQPAEKSIESEEYEEYKEQTTTTLAPKKKHKHKKLKSKKKEHLKEMKTMEKDKETTNENNDDAAALAEHQLQQHAKQAANALSASLSSSSTHEEHHRIQQSFAMELNDQDGLSDRPNGAILSLTFGLLITAALAVLIGCRLRTVRRRPRRLGSKAPSHSQDAEFLVNGMYL